MPANTYSVNPEEDILRDLRVLQVSDKDLKEIEESTRNQADTALWHHLSNLF